jgi:Ca-activated chloride channel family protein
MKRVLMVLSFFWVGIASAFSWQDLWFTKDQQAQQMIQTGDFEKAKETFIREDWRATSAYRAGDYDQAASVYKRLDQADGYYNQGNALAHMGQYEQAIQAYDQALKRNPKHEDAIYNRQIVDNLLKKQKQDQQKQDQQKQDQQRQDQQKQDQQKQDQQTQDQQKQDQQTQDQQKQDQQKQDQQTQDQQKQDQQKQDQQKQDQQTQNQEPQDHAPSSSNQSEADRENKQAMDQWLRLIPDDPGGLLREKFLRDHLRRQNGWRP